MLGVSLLIIEPFSPPPLARGFDLSELLFDLSSILTLLMGLFVVVAAVNRVRGQLDHAFNHSDLPVQTRLKMARTARMRAAWMILVGIMLLTLGAVLAALPEGALVVHPSNSAQESEHRMLWTLDHLHGLRGLCDHPQTRTAHRRHAAHFNTEP